MNTISDTDMICSEIGIEARKTSIVLDGGNVVRSRNKVIMTDRVFKENPTFTRKELIRELYDLLEIEQLYFVPAQPGDFTGHADGMVRFLDDDTVVINDYQREKDWFYNSFEIAIHNTNLDYVRIPYNVYNNKSNDQANGDYINYLQMKDVVFIPTFGIKEDEEALKIFETLFAGKSIATIDSNDIADNGGILNCISWNILAD